MIKSTNHPKKKAMQLKSLIFLFFANIYTVRFDAGMKAGANDLVILLSNRGLLIFLVLLKT